MLEGVVPFPPRIAQRWREKGYWQDKSLARGVRERLRAGTHDRIALIDGERQYTYGDIDRLSDRLALNLLALGLKPLDRVVLALPNVAEFVMLYFALQKIGAIPIAALATHRYAEISQFVRIARGGRMRLPGAAERLRVRADGAPRTGGEPVPAVSCIGLGALRELIDREPALAGRRAPGDPHRPRRSVHLPAVGRHDRRARSSSRARTTTTRTTRRPRRRCAA